MEHVLLQDLSPGMRLDGSLYLPGGELVLCGGQAVDDILLAALADCGAAELYLCTEPGRGRESAEVEALALQAGREPVSLDDVPARARFPWGLYEANGRKLLSAGGGLTPALKASLRAAGVDLAFEPASDLAPRLARRRRRLVGRARRRPGLPPPAAGWAPRAAGAAVSNPERRAAAARAASGTFPPGEARLAHALLASEVEAVTEEASLGLALDVPRALDAARSAVEAARGDRSPPVACAIESLSSGRLRDHAAASAAIAVSAARNAGQSDDRCLELAACALLHDTGMAWVGREHLRERGPLSEAGRRAVRRHPTRALGLLADADGLSPGVALTAFQVHERADGSGYPSGLTGDEIAPAARLLAAVDVLCALLAPRAHRAGLPGKDAMDLCVRLAGEGELDAEAVRMLLRAVGRYPVGSAVWLTTGELARVVAPSGDDYDRPVVGVILTPAGVAPAEGRVMDLAQLPDVAVDRPATRDEIPPAHGLTNAGFHHGDTESTENDNWNH